MNVAAQAPDRGRKKPLHPPQHDLSARRAGLLELMQTINFGRIEGLAILDGDPVLDPPPRVIREVKFGGENGPRPELDDGNFLLKTQVIELFPHSTSSVTAPSRCWRSSTACPSACWSRRPPPNHGVGPPRGQQTFHSPDILPAAKRWRLWATPIMALLASPPLRVGLHHFGA